MKVIFLDFDGVLNNNEVLDDAYQLAMHLRASGEPNDYIRVAHDYAMVDRVLVGRVQEICECTGAVVVISSTWRILNTLVELREILATKGLKAEVIGVTPRKMSGYRGEEIGIWLNEHPEVEFFVILDDGSDMDPHSDRLVQTDCEEGIQDRHVSRAVELLNPQEGA